MLRALVERGKALAESLSSITMTTDRGAVRVPDTQLFQQMGRNMKVIKKQT